MGIKDLQKSLERACVAVPTFNEAADQLAVLANLKAQIGFGCAGFFEVCGEPLAEVVHHNTRSMADISDTVNPKYLICPKKGNAR